MTDLFAVVEKTGNVGDQHCQTESGTARRICLRLSLFVGILTPGFFFPGKGGKAWGLVINFLP